MRVCVQTSCVRISNKFSGAQDDFNAVMPMSTLTQVYIAYTNASDAIALLQPGRPSKPYLLR